MSPQPQEQYNTMQMKQQQYNTRMQHPQLRYFTQQKQPPNYQQQPQQIQQLQQQNPPNPQWQEEQTQHQQQQQPQHLTSSLAAAPTNKYPMGLTLDTTSTPHNKRKELALGAIELCEPHCGEGENGEDHIGLQESFVGGEGRSR